MKNTTERSLRAVILFGSLGTLQKKFLFLFFYCCIVATVSSSQVRQGTSYPNAIIPFYKSKGLLIEYFLINKRQ